MSLPKTPLNSLKYQAYPGLSKAYKLSYRKILAVIALDSMSKLVVVLGMVLLLILSIGVVFGKVVVAEVVDALGRRVAVPSTIKRVVTLSPAITEVLAYLELDDLIVGADSISLQSWFMNVGEKLKARNVTSIGGYWWTTISVEAIASLKPDLVLADVGAHRALLEALEEANLTVLYLHGGSASKLEQVYSDALLVGAVLGKLSKAAEFIALTERNLAQARSMLSSRGLQGLKVLVVVDLTGGIWIAGKDTFIDDLISKLGLVNAAALSGWASVSVEQVASWNPDVVLVASWSATEEALKASGLPGLGKPIVVLNSTEVDIISRPGALTMLAPGVIASALLRAGLAPLGTGTQTTHTYTYTITKTTTTTETTTLTGVAQQVGVTQQPLVIALAAVLVVVAGVAGYYAGSRRAGH